MIAHAAPGARLRRREALTGQERFLAWFGGFSLAFSVFVIISALVSWQYRLKALTQMLWGGGLGSKALLVLLLLVLSLPLVMGLGESDGLGHPCGGQADADVLAHAAWAHPPAAGNPIADGAFALPTLRSRAFCSG